MNISGGRIQLLALILQMCEQVSPIRREDLQYRLRSRSEIHTKNLTEDSLRLGLGSGLILEKADSGIELTHLGKSAIRSDGKEDFEVERRILSRLITTVRRDLLKIGFMSTEELSELGSNERECLEQFGLLDYHLSTAAENWWENLRSAGKSFNSAILREVGDRAELASIHYEEKRVQMRGLVGKAIDWVSRETDLAGYDILSFTGEPPAQEDRLCIEVKKLTNDPTGGVYFFLSRNEAEVAKKSRHYVFHLWQIQINSESWTLSVIPAEVVLEKLPSDAPYAKWEKCRVRLEAVELERYLVDH